jgi:hypothetical protein
MVQPTSRVTYHDRNSCATGKLHFSNAVYMNKFMYNSFYLGRVFLHADGFCASYLMVARRSPLRSNVRFLKTGHFSRYA